MKYTIEVNIKAPREKVVRLFQDPDGVKEWQPGFVGMTHLSGEKGKAGSKTLMKYKNKGREMEIEETIVKNELPELFISTYDASGVHNIVRSHFIESENETTTYRSENEFHFTNFMMKAFGFFMPGAFKKQTQSYLDLFKLYVEKSD